MTQRVSDLIGEEGEVRLHTVIKNNSVKLDGISVFAKNRNVSPTIYLNDFYESYKEGCPIEELVRDITHIFERKNAMLQCPNMDFFKEYEKVSERIVYKVINYNRNKELLETIPHVKYMNLAVVFYYLVSNSKFENATVLINNKHLEMWGKDIEDMVEVASKNTPDILECEIKKLSDIIVEEMSEELGMEIAEEIGDDNTPMYVMTNKKRIYGAACMLYPNVIKEFAEKMNSDIFILPSSVHELIMIPVNRVDGSGELAQMVREVNMTQVALEEILSDNVYIYSRKTNSISISL